jgi:hypothetical protein
MTQNSTPKQPQPAPKPAAKRPDDRGTVSVEGFIKIFDPNTKEKFVEKRA